MKNECGCELTDDNIFKPCKKHWQLLHDSILFKTLTGGEIDVDASLKLGVPIVKSCPPLWMKPETYQKLINSTNKA